MNQQKMLRRLEQLSDVTKILAQEVYQKYPYNHNVSRTKTIKLLENVEELNSLARTLDYLAGGNPPPKVG